MAKSRNRPAIKTALDPERLGIVKLVGGGLHGSVYQAIDCHGMKYAVKVINVQSDSKTVEQVQNEVRLLKRVQNVRSHLMVVNGYLSFN